MDDYFRAKTRLFTEHMVEGGKAVLPVVEGRPESPAWLATLHEICAQAGKKVVSWGEGGTASVSLVNHTAGLTRTDLVLHTPSGQHRFSTPLVGRFNIDNILTVVAMSCALGIDEAQSCRALAVANGAPGRLERVSLGDDWPVQAPAVFVDYAHTPDALETVIEALRPHTKGRLWVVFGCGGDRDPGKRPEMGRIACRLADKIVVTDDNPRSENPALIRSQILAACPGAKEIGDRRQAIHAAIAGLSAEDLLIVAGKGHERGQIVGKTVHPFNDADVVRDVLAEVRG